MCTTNDLIKEYDKQALCRLRAFNVYEKAKIGSWNRKNAFYLYLHFDGRCRMINNLLIKSVSALD